jgi:hypothetical protein
MIQWIIFSEGRVAAQGVYVAEDRMKDWLSQSFIRMSYMTCI